MKSNKVIVALDSNNIEKIEKLVFKLKSEAFAFKIGYQFFLNFGIEGYKKIFKICPNIFLDLKLHDIPNTVENGMKAIMKLKPLLTTIHITGGDKMMRASLVKNKKTKIIGVSVLTSLNKQQTKKYFNESNISKLVRKFAGEAKRSNLDGIVCSPKEINYVRKIIGKNILIITPGVRLKNNNIINDDQSRTLTPKKAIELGADLLVIGRPITSSKNPLLTIKEINNSIK